MTALQRVISPEWYIFPLELIFGSQKQYHISTYNNQFVIKIIKFSAVKLGLRKIFCDVI